MLEGHISSITNSVCQMARPLGACRQFFPPILPNSQKSTRLAYPKVPVFEPAIRSEGCHGNSSANRVCHEVEESSLPEVWRQDQYAAGSLPTVPPIAESAQETGPGQRVAWVAGRFLRYIFRRHHLPGNHRTDCVSAGLAFCATNRGNSPCTTGWSLSSLPASAALLHSCEPQCWNGRPRHVTPLRCGFLFHWRFHDVILSDRRCASRTYFARLAH